MKKVILLLLVMLFFARISYGQGIYIRAGSGYGSPMASSTLGELLTSTGTNDGVNTVNTNSKKGVKGSYGSGLDFNLAIGYKFNENFIFELGTQYLIGNKYKVGNDYRYTSPSYSYSDNSDRVTSANAILLNPSFVFSAGFGKLAPYGRFGVLMGSPKVTTDELSYYDGDGTSITDRTGVHSKGFSFGFQGAVGMNWKLSGKFDIYTEINYQSITYFPGEYNLIKYTYSDGINPPVDNLPNTLMIDKKTIYKKTFDPTTVNVDNTQPRTETPESFAFSSISLQVGLRFTFWNKKEE
jgi:hypothetical protein